MNYWDDIMEILDAAGRIKPPHQRLDVVSIARREVAKRGGCENKFIAPIEVTLRECLWKWSLEQKRKIWLITETGAGNTVGFEAYDEASIDMDLEGELMPHIIRELSPQKRRSISDFDDDDPDEF